VDVQPLAGIGSRRARNAGLFLSGATLGVVCLLVVQYWMNDALPAPRIEATVFLPLVDNDDKPFAEERWREVLGLFADGFGGATLGSPQEGCWRDDAGRLRREPIRPLIVSFEREHLSRFRQTVDDVGHQLGQEAVYIRFETPRVEVRRVPARAREIDR
jgi:hypothetical protein